MHSRPRRILAVLLTVVALVGVHLAIHLGPSGIGLVIGPVAAIVLALLARQVGLTWDDLGLGRHTWKKGAAYGGVAVGIVGAVYAVGLTLPLTRGMFLDIRYDMAIGSAVLLAVVIIPLKTVLLEEMAFRGVLFGLLKHPFGSAWAIGVTSTLFGLWHILPSLKIGEQNQALDAAAGAGAGAQVLIVLGVVAFTAIAGVLFAELRRRSGSLLAAVGLHWATNGLGVLLSSLVWAARIA